MISTTAQSALSLDPSAAVPLGQATGTLPQGQVDGLPTRAMGPQPVTVANNALGSSRVSVTTTGDTYRTRQRVTVSCANLVLRFANWYSGGWGETPNTDSIEVKAAIEFPIGTILPAYFRGARRATLEGGAVIDSDPVGLSVTVGLTGMVTDASPTTTAFAVSLLAATGSGATASTFAGYGLRFLTGANATTEPTGERTERAISASTIDSSTGATSLTCVAWPIAPATGDVFELVPYVYVRAYAGPPGGSGTINYPVGRKMLNGGNSPPYETRATASDLVDSGSFGGPSNTFAFGPVAVLGDPTAGASRGVAIIGHSIPRGVGSANPGTTVAGDGLGEWSYAVKACVRLGLPCVKVAKSGELLTDFQNMGTSIRRRLRPIAVRGCRYAFVDYGTNDIGVRTTAAIMASVLEITAALNALGMKVYWATITPKTGSSDGWTTTLNQSFVSATETQRQNLNAWLRGTSANGYVAQAGGSARAAVNDVASAVEVNSSGVASPTGGYWKAGTLYASGTGTGATSATITDSGASWTTNQHAGRLLYSYTSGNAYVQGEIVSNTATVLTVSVFSATPASGKAYGIFSGYTIDGIHPSELGHTAESLVIAL